MSHTDQPSVWLFVRPSKAICSYYEVVATLAGRSSTAWTVPHAPLYTDTHTAWSATLALAQTSGTLVGASYMDKDEPMAIQVRVDTNSPAWLLRAASAWRLRPCLLYIYENPECEGTWQVLATATTMAWYSVELTSKAMSTREAADLAYQLATVWGVYNGLAWLSRLERTAHSIYLRPGEHSFLHDMLAAAEVWPT